MVLCISKAVEPPCRVLCTHGSATAKKTWACGRALPCRGLRPIGGETGLNQGTVGTRSALYAERPDLPI